MHPAAVIKCEARKHTVPPQKHHGSLTDGLNPKWKRQEMMKESSWEAGLWGKLAMKLVMKRDWKDKEWAHRHAAPWDQASLCFAMCLHQKKKKILLWQRNDWWIYLRWRTIRNNTLAIKRVTMTSLLVHPGWISFLFSRGLVNKLKGNHFSPMAPY